MSKQAISLLVVVGGIVLWGFLTDWTFSGLLPREGARCTPGKDEKVENAEEYIYDADKKCLVVNKCKEGWEPNYSNTACISELSGDTCTASNPDQKGVYRYDTSGVCVLDSCVAGYMPSGNECVVEPTISDKQTAPNEYSGNLFLDRHDVRCDSGALNQFVLKDGGTQNNLFQVYYDYKCIENIPGFSLGDEQETSKVIRTDNDNNHSISTRFLTDPYIGVDCVDSPISRFQLDNVGVGSSKNALLYRYNCANKEVKTGTCTDKESTGISNIDDARAILENEVACDGKGVITQFQLAKKDDTVGNYYYKYRCCDLY